MKNLIFLILGSCFAVNSFAAGKPIVSRNHSTVSPTYTVQSAPVTVSKSVSSAAVNGTVQSVKAKPRACYTYVRGVRTGVTSCVD